MFTLTFILTCTSMALLGFASGAQTSKDILDTCDDQVDGVVMLQVRKERLGSQASGAKSAATGGQSTAGLSNMHHAAEGMMEAVAGFGVHGDENYGLSKCPCIGLEGMPGLMTLEVNGTKMSYPLDVGAKCRAWDETTHPSCKTFFSGEQPPAWCTQSWCYVDPCNCDITPQPLEPQGLPTPTHHGRSVYVSYSTCGEKVDFEEGNKELAGAGCSTAELSAVAKAADTAKFGDEQCPCIGIANRTGTGYFAFGFYQFPADVASYCGAWDMAAPQCNVANPPDWCPAKYCYVDPCNCNLSTPPTRSEVPVKYQGQSTYYSYETCGEPSTWLDTDPDVHCRSPSEADCTKDALCVWTDRQGCVGKEFASCSK